MKEDLIFMFIMITWVLGVGFLTVYIQRIFSGTPWLLPILIIELYLFTFLTFQLAEWFAEREQLKLERENE